ncbi:MAG: DUF423 domain-containing protein [Flavobacteriaceae bacterium]|nr:DUF423 domain-containing protein [Flavobacteriaceae bacterium]
MNKKLVIAGLVLGVLAVVLGAFAAHGLKPLISADSMVTFQTGVRYQMYHGLLLLFLSTTSVFDDKLKKSMLFLVIVGIVLFSGSIYGLATNVLTSFDFTVIGFVTPIGGFLLIISWLIMLIKIIKTKA